MVNKYYPPHLGGVEFHVRDLAEGLVEHAGMQVRAIVCNSENTRLEETLHGVDVVRLPRAFERASTPVAWSFARELAAEARRDPWPDVFHFHFPYPWGELAWLRAQPDAPTVVTYHSDIVRQKTALAAYRPLLERFLDSVDLIIASSPNMIEHSEFLSPRAEKCRHVDFGLHVERFAGDASTRAACRRAAGRARRAQDRAVRGSARLLQGRRRARPRDGARRRRPRHDRHAARSSRELREIAVARGHQPTG